MGLTFLLLLIGFVLLIKGADFFVDGASGIAKALKVPSLIIGLTIVALGTSLPEASVSVSAAIKGANELAISNVIGSNIFNLLVVAGASSLIKPMTVHYSVIKREFPFSILITILLLILSMDQVLFQKPRNIISGMDGVILLVLFTAFLIYTVRTALAARKEDKHVMEEKKKNDALIPLWKCFLFIMTGIAGIIWGGNLVVNSATKIALSFGLSETLVGLTIVAAGTSLPELVTSIVAALKSESDLALGNVIGSNIFNILFILGASASIRSVPVTLFNIYDIVILIAVSILAYIFTFTKRNLNKLEGFFMLSLYFVFTAFIILR